MNLSRGGMSHHFLLDLSSNRAALHLYEKTLKFKSVITIILYSGERKLANNGLLGILYISSVKHGPQNILC